jgi:hypothetical protein
LLIVWWLAQPSAIMDSIDEIARSVEQRVESCRRANDFIGEEIARRCVQRIRGAGSPADAAAIEREFFGRAPAALGQPAAPRGCLGGLFGGLSRSSPGPSWRSTPSSYNTFGYNEGLAYSMFDGLLRLGGSSSWRNHNPGQIPYDEWSIANGAIGSDNGMAVFPSYEAGRRALAANLTSTPGDQTVDQLVKNSYLSNIPDTAMQAAGIDPNTPAAKLSPDQMNHLLDAVENSRGFEAGKAVSHDSSDAPSWAGDLFAADAAWGAESTISSDSPASSASESRSSSGDSSSLPRVSDNS